MGQYGKTIQRLRTNSHYSFDHAALPYGLLADTNAFFIQPRSWRKKKNPITFCLKVPTCLHSNNWKVCSWQFYNFFSLSPPTKKYLISSLSSKPFYLHVTDHRRSWFRHHWTIRPINLFIKDCGGQTQPLVFPTLQQHGTRDDLFD